MARPTSAETKEDLKWIDLLSLIRITADLSLEKVRTQQTQEMVVPYAQPYLLIKGLPVSYKKQFPLYPYLEWLKTLGE